MEIKDIREVFQTLGQYLPEGGVQFVLARLMESNVRSIVLQKNTIALFLKGIAAGYCPEDREIVIDLDRDWDAYAESLGRYKLGMRGLTKEEACLWLCCHEIGHSRPEIEGDERKADEWATSQFVKFKRS